MRISLQKLREEKRRLEQELVEAKEKAIQEYNSSMDFFDDVAKESLGIYHEGFEDYQKKIKELFPYINMALLFLSVLKLGVTIVIESMMMRYLLKSPLYLLQLLKLLFQPHQWLKLQ